MRINLDGTCWKATSNDNKYCFGENKLRIHHPNGKTISSFVYNLSQYNDELILEIASERLEVINYSADHIIFYTPDRELFSLYRVAAKDCFISF
jgi:hypothetical protein